MIVGLTKSHNSLHSIILAVRSFIFPNIYLEIGHPDIVYSCGVYATISI